MKKTMYLLAALMLMFLAGVASAQTASTHTYGGSERDWLYHMATSDDGLIALTGWTESSDGTLSGRTKTGRSGWLLVIDSEGKEIVNFCTRLGNHDNLAYPVFHADGTLTVMLFAEDANLGWVKLELIRLNMDGAVVSREVLMEKGVDDEYFVDVIGHDERGYIFSQRLIQKEGGYTHYELFDYDGGYVRRLDEWNGLNAFADAHVLRFDQEDGKEIYLYARDAQDIERQLSKAFDLREDKLRPVMYDGFISLPDGGAAGCGWVLEKDEKKEERIGLFTRWDAQGNIVSEMRTPGVFFGDMVMIPGGFAATAYPIGEDGWFDYSICSLYLFDGRGMMTGTIPLASDANDTGHNACVGALGDGTIVTAHVVPENGEDTVVTVIRP